eukprot:TRINITY_DN1901_c0_g4_i1.p1 TRINITY_DN1901_c0_g4~~TRINITY_DN1901_c0_g4_i1.p1  ORF type:complete len:497 (-),score=63.75 TRINITY_DN1901_c0_g4_i1:85-1575(-)
MGQQMERLVVLVLVTLSLVAVLFAEPSDAQPWKKYPLVLESNPLLTLPAVEGPQYQYSGDSWFLAAQVQGLTTGKTYHVITIYDRNTLFISEATFDFYQMSIFDYSTGKYGTYTDYDLPVFDIIYGDKFSAVAGSLDIAFDSGAGNASWSTVRDSNGNLVPFVQRIYSPGKDIYTGQPLSFTLDINMQKAPVAYGASTLRGFLEFYGQTNTLSYFQTAPEVTGSITYNGITEQIKGTVGHFDRQIFPDYAGIDTPTGRQHSHEWRQIHLNNGVDLAIWRQFDRVNNNTVMETTGVTTAPNGGADPQWVDGLPSDLTVEYISYSKYPSSIFTTLLPPPSENMWLPSEHIVRSKAMRMELRCVYINDTPAVTLPVEYFEGPAIWTGTFNGENVTGIGVFESTLALYQDYELADVLYNSVAHLPDKAFKGVPQKEQTVSAVNKLRFMVSANPALDNRIQARQYVTYTVFPLLQQLAVAPFRSKMLEIARDFNSSLSSIW